MLDERRGILYVPTGSAVTDFYGADRAGKDLYANCLLALDAATGKLLWQYTMEFAGNATPATYMVDGKQYVVIAVSNARNPKAPQGAKYIAFSLP